MERRKNKTAEGVQADIARHCEKLYVNGSHMIPDPFKLDQGWVRYWPVTLYRGRFKS